MDVINSKKKKGQNMPYQCEICGNYKAVKKDLRDMINCENNNCYNEQVWFHNKEKRISMYKPFTNSKKEIEITCSGFSHIRILRAR